MSMKKRKKRSKARQSGPRQSGRTASGEAMGETMQQMAGQKRAEPNQQLATLIERARLAKQGLAQCDCGCGRIVPLKDALVTFYRGNIIQSLALTCFGKYDYLIRRVPGGINIRTLPAGSMGDARGSIVPASSLSDIRQAVKEVQEAGQFHRKVGG